MSEAAPVLLQGPFLGRVAFIQLIRDTLHQAAQEGWKQMIWSDLNFEDWPLHEKAVSDSLFAWAGTGRKLVMLSKSYDSILKYKPRMVAWRQKWSHIVDARLFRHIDDEKFPSVLWGPSWMLQRQEMEQHQGFATVDVAKRVQCHELLQGMYQRSTPGFPANILGL
jgi:hypothetical protein